MKLIKLNLKKLSNNEFNHNNNYLKFLNTINNFN